MAAFTLVLEDEWNENIKEPTKIELWVVEKVVLTLSHTNVSIELSYV